MIAARRRWLGRGLACAVPLAAVGLYGPAERALGRATRASAAVTTSPTADVCIVAPTWAYDPASGRPAQAPRDVPVEARCPVCGMFPARHRAWAAQVIFSDGDVHFLDSPLSLFHYLQRVERYATGRRRADIAHMYVSDQRTGGWLHAAQAVYVHGSQARGPMRSGDLPAFDSLRHAQAFVARFGGRTLSYGELERQLPPELQRLSPHAH